MTSLRFLAAFAALSVFSSLSQAGSGIQRWQRNTPITTFARAKAACSTYMMLMQCAHCKTAMVHSLGHMGMSSMDSADAFVPGAKHTCDECGGEITVVKGKTDEAMQMNCSKCGEASVSCCAIPSEKTDRSPWRKTRLRPDAAFGR